MRLHSTSLGNDFRRNAVGFAILGNLPKPDAPDETLSQAVRFNLFDDDNYRLPTTLNARVRILTNDKTAHLSEVRKTVVYVFEKRVDDGDAAVGASALSRYVLGDYSCCSVDGDDAAWRRAGCSYPAVGSFGEVARPSVIETKASIDQFSPVPQHEIILLDWHYPGGWEPTWEYAQDVASDQWSFEPKSRRDMYRSTVYHRYTSSDTSLLGKNVASLHYDANIVLYPEIHDRRVFSRAPTRVATDDSFRPDP